MFVAGIWFFIRASELFLFTNCGVISRYKSHCDNDCENILEISFLSCCWVTAGSCNGEGKFVVDDDFPAVLSSLRFKEFFPLTLNFELELNDE